MDDPVLMGFFERLGDLLRDVDRFVDGNRPTFEPRGEILALDQLEHQKRLAVRFLEAVDGGDVRVVERGEQVRLALETREALGILRDCVGKDLDGYVTTEVLIRGAIDLSHPAFADLGGDPVVGKAGADHASGRSVLGKSFPVQRRGSSESRATA